MIVCNRVITVQRTNAAQNSFEEYTIPKRSNLVAKTIEDDLAALE
jgi:hypothetical protein